ncbi:MAG: hypothetical protein HYV42_00195 [Candidatus Magasanikbacteria bacterium]|nr:hypothetical protein [Candidatus Magasanikbacteria bacterium]
MSGLIRIISYALQDIGRNAGLSAMTVFMLVLMLLSLNVVWTVNQLAGESIALVKKEVRLSVFLAPDIADRSIDELENYLRSFPEVISVSRLNRDQALAEFKARYAGRGEVLSALNELTENPFGPIFMVAARDPADYQRLISALALPEYDRFIEGTSFEAHAGALERLGVIIRRVTEGGIILLGLFSLIAFLIIFNTVRVAISTQRAEISIKRLVGAGSWFIRGPYLVAAVLFAVVSVALTITLVLITLRYVDPYLRGVFTNGFSLTNYYRSHILVIIGGQLLAVLVLTVLSSGLAMRRQLRV